MDSKDFKNSGKHDCCPKQWKETPVITGDFELDASIMASHNADLPQRLKLYCNAGPYGQLTGYNGYNGYNGDN